VTSPLRVDQDALDTAMEEALGSPWEDPPVEVLPEPREAASDVEHIHYAWQCVRLGWESIFEWGREYPWSLGVPPTALLDANRHLQRVHGSLSLHLELLSPRLSRRILLCAVTANGDPSARSAAELAWQLAPTLRRMHVTCLRPVLSRKILVALGGHVISADEVEVRVLSKTGDGRHCMELRQAMQGAGSGEGWNAIARELLIQAIGEANFMDTISGWRWAERTAPDLKRGNRWYPLTSVLTAIWPQP
jgi:hypothetical protein